MKLFYFSLAFLAVFCGKASAAEEWCYDEECGPETSAWPKLCHEGESQSPINIHTILFPTGQTTLRLQAYKSNDSFRLQNNGHSLYVDFAGEDGENQGPTSEEFSFPDAGKAMGFNEKRQKKQNYKFASAHFHWGRNSSEGSEHCFSGTCSAMEIHFVHYSTNYSSFGEALKDTENPNALAVLGVLIEASPSQDNSSSALAPIIKNMGSVQQASAGNWVTVEEPLDFTKLLHSRRGDQVYTYKGSLTTPDCQQIVNWFVLKKPGKVSQDELKAFRTQLQQGGGKVLDHNYRPLQERNERKIHLSNVKASE